jgi:uncharacterized membrane protein
MLSLAIFVLCFLISTFTSSKTFNKTHSARAVRSEYRRNWAKETMKNADSDSAVDVFRNSMTVSSAMMGGLVIAFGLVANALLSTTDSEASLQFAFILFILTYAIFNILMQIRTLMYLPIILKVPGDIIEKNEKVSKIEYVSKLLDNSYDDFSNAIRSLFYLIVLLAFSLDKLLFIVVTIILTYLFVRRDLSEKSRIEIF